MAKAGWLRWTVHVHMAFSGDVRFVFLSISQSALGPHSLSETTYLLSELEGLRELSARTSIDSCVRTRTCNVYTYVRGASYKR